jgi:hypothetical protein
MLRNKKSLIIAVVGVLLSALVLTFFIIQSRRFKNIKQTYKEDTAIVTAVGETKSKVSSNTKTDSNDMNKTTSYGLRVKLQFKRIL